jgi:hypothetical protein
MSSSNHTGRELELMLEGKKPLAMFYAQANELPWEELVPEDAFAPYVQSGRLVRQDFELQSSSKDASSLLRYVFYALPGNEWRIQLMLVLKQALHSGGGWNETCERIEGTLLGYTDEENDAHCAQGFPRRAP